MPRIAILSDIHANAPAFKAVLKAVKKVRAKRVVFGGDIVGYGASPEYCVAKTRALGGESVLGNHDHYTNEIRQGVLSLPRHMEWRRNPVWAGVAEAASALGDDAADWLAALPRELPLPGGVLSHAALHQPGEWPYLRSLAEARPTLEILRDSGRGIGFFGHTHRQELFFDPADEVVPEEIKPARYHLPEGVACAVMVGSVGQPRDHDTRAGWALWDSDSRVLEFHRTAYPARRAAQDIIAADLPWESAVRLLDDGEAMDFRRTLGL